MNKKIIDLTMEINEGMQTFPTHWHPFVEITQLGRHGIENRETRKVTLGTHTGTHVDAPKHFIKNAGAVDKIPLDQLMGKASLIDLTEFSDNKKVSKNNLKIAIGKKDIRKILLHFGWDKKLGTNDYYTKNPFISEEAAEWLVNEGCHLVGMDTPMPDDPKNNRDSCNDSPVHKILLSNNVVLVEYLVNLNLINQNTFFLVVSPLKIKDADGSPARVVAILEDYFLT